MWNRCPSGPRTRTVFPIKFATRLRKDDMAALLVRLRWFRPGRRLKVVTRPVHNPSRRKRPVIPATRKRCNVAACSVVGKSGRGPLLRVAGLALHRLTHDGADSRFPAPPFPAQSQGQLQCKDRWPRAPVTPPAAWPRRSAVARLVLRPRRVASDQIATKHESRAAWACRMCRASARAARAHSESPRAKSG
jgi:hypothetical protein